MRINQLFIIIFFNSCIINSGKSTLFKESDLTQTVSISQPCNIDVLVSIDKVGTFKVDEIKLLISVIDSQCVVNVEFMQFANELVFKALINNHVDFIEEVINFNQRDFIYKIIENPISDEISLDEIISKIESENLIKNEKILMSLKIAKKKSE